MLVKERRKKLGLTQHELAEALEVSNASISKWERGEKPIPTGRYKDLAEALGMTVGELVGEKRFAREHEMDSWRELVHEDRSLQPWVRIILVFISRRSRTVDNKIAFIGGVEQATRTVMALDEDEVAKVWPALLASAYVEPDEASDDLLMFTFPTEN